MKHTMAVNAIVFMFAFLASVPGAWAENFTNSVGMEMVRIEPGSFEMGSDMGRDFWDEQPVHTVKISKEFYISATEVTVEQFKQFKAEFTGSGKSLPYATGVSWYEAAAFCEWLSPHISWNFHIFYLQNSLTACSVISYVNNYTLTERLLL